MTTTLLISPTATRRPFSDIESGDLVTVNVYNPATGEFDQEAGARVKRIACGSVWVQLAGLTAPDPYLIGDNLVVDERQVTDW